MLVDPDKFKERIIQTAVDAGIDFFLVGGSLLSEGDMGKVIGRIKRKCRVPVIIFPGSPLQIDKKADGILLLSLISGRNPEYLIGHHVISAQTLKKSGLEIIPAGYILIDSGKATTASYISHSHPIPWDKDDIAACTAVAGELLGLKMIYLDCGSGAAKPPSASMVRQVRKNISVPLIAGGGIRNPLQAKELFEAGADIVVIGNAAEENAGFIKEIVLVKDNRR